ncbi:MAG: serine hydrolase, partial [Flavobacteriales bacterium]|nr:serine hydrolase [Flavobacteriales bacterium]
KYLLELINGYSGNGILINKESYKEYFKEQLASENFTDRSDWDAFDDEYNSGIFMGFSPKGYIGHRGSDPGIFSFLFFDPKTKVGRLLFVNTDLDSDGMNEFMSIWKKLDEYSKKIIVSR